MRIEVGVHPSPINNYMLTESKTYAYKENKANQMAIRRAKTSTMAKRVRGGQKVRYPLDTMRVDESVKVNGKCRTAPYHLAWSANRRFPKKRFEGGYDTKGVARLWRIK